MLEDVHIQLKQQVGEKEAAYKNAQVQLEEKERHAEEEAKKLREQIESQEKTLNDENAKAKERIDAAESMAANLKTVISNHESENAELKRKIESLQKAAQETAVEHAEEKRAMEQKLQQERLLQESALKDSELQKLDLIKKQLNAEKNDEIELVPPVQNDVAEFYPARRLKHNHSRASSYMGFSATGATKVKMRLASRGG